MTDNYRAAAVSAVLTKEICSLLVVSSHENATRCVELMDRLREHDEFAFECLRQDDDPKLKAMATFVAGIPRRADRQVPSSMPRSVEPEPLPVRSPVQHNRLTPWTYADRAEFEATQDRGGRFAKMNEFIAPGEVPQYPRQPSTSPWFRDPVPPEPSTGYCIDALPGQEPKVSEPTREELIQEIARLRAALAETQSGVSAPVRSAVADAASAGGEQVEASGPLSADFSSSAQKEEPHG
jgi:hypothetical protein